jgi:hypothetical protein
MSNNKKVYVKKVSGEEFVFAPKGARFYAKFMTPEGIEDFATIKRMENGSAKLVFTKDSILDVEELHPNHITCKHIRFIRERRQKSGLHWELAKQWSRLRAALCQTEATHHYCGGFASIPLYGDEIAVKNYAVSGSSGWIILRKDIDSYLATVPFSDEKIQQLTARADALEAELENIFSDESLRQAAGGYSWFEANMACLPRAIDDAKEWIKVVVHFDGSNNKSFGYNSLRENPDGDLSYYARGWCKDVRYKSLPQGAVDVPIDSYRYLGLFDNSDEYNINNSGWTQIEIDCMVDNRSIHHIEFTKEQVIQYINKNNAERMKSLREKIRKIRISLKLETARKVV